MKSFCSSCPVCLHWACCLGVAAASCVKQWGGLRLKARSPPSSPLLNPTGACVRRAVGHKECVLRVASLSALFAAQPALTQTSYRLEPRVELHGMTTWSGGCRAASTGRCSASSFYSCLVCIAGGSQCRHFQASGWTLVAWTHYFRPCWCTSYRACVRYSSVPWCLLSPAPHIERVTATFSDSCRHNCRQSECKHKAQTPATRVITWPRVASRGGGTGSLQA